MSKTVDELVEEAVTRCAERVTIERGREPTRAEVTDLFVQTQLSVLSMYVCRTDEELKGFWEDVVTVALQGRVPGAAS